jgi:hypothetical protein
MPQIMVAVFAKVHLARKKYCHTPQISPDSAGRDMLF